MHGGLRAEVQGEAQPALSRDEVQHRDVQGEVRYGNWMGPIHPDCPEFGGRPFAHHGWVEKADGSIVDPTRWVFEHVKPYIYEGPNDHYDAGGNEIREARIGSRPPALEDVPDVCPPGDA